MDYTFEQFLIEGANREAHAAAYCVASAPGESYNPLWIHGESGIGKTHLLGAIERELKAYYPGKKISHISLLDVAALQQYPDDSHVLLLDDAEALYHLPTAFEMVNELMLAALSEERQVVVAGRYSYSYLHRKQCDHPMLHVPTWLEVGMRGSEFLC